MRWIVLFVFAFVIACATTKSTKPVITAPSTTKVATPRDDCPQGYLSVSSNAGTACWPADKEVPPASCKPFRCPATGYMLWDCPPRHDEAGNRIIGEVPTPELTARTVEPLQWKNTYLVNSDGAFQCECATNAAGTTICKDCHLMASADPTLQERLKAEFVSSQCLAQMGPARMRKAPHTSAPGQILTHNFPDDQPYAEYHYYRNRDTDQHFVCPLQPHTVCDRRAQGDRLDEGCALYAECSEVCLDLEGEVVW